MEKWKDIPGYEGLYQASDNGRIKSLVGNKGKKREKILSPTSCTGYYRITLTKGKIEKKVLVSRMVLMSFSGIEGEQCNHKDGNKLNNNLCNLEWVTQSENMRHALDTGLKVMPKGENHHMAILSEDKVRRILFLKGKVEKGYWMKLSKALGVNHTTISRIVCGKNWKYL